SPRYVYPNQPVRQSKKIEFVNGLRRLLISDTPPQIHQRRGKYIWTSSKSSALTSPQYVPSSKGETLSIYSPNDESLVTDKVQVASEADVDRAVDAAKAAFPKWRDTAGHKRAAIMYKFADLLEKNVDKLAKLESIAMGQPISVAKKFILAPAMIWKYYAGYAGKVAGESFPPDEDGTYKIVQYEPLGVCAGICAWNGSHVLAAWKMGPAMATGNTFILKSSEKSPLALAAYGDLINEAGFPPGVINIVTGAGPVGAMLARAS
ncbi:hypothetical protein LTR74_004178, partial [Friedmanniomyces endolithicus]